MKLNVAENAKRNVLWGGIRKLYQTLVPFVLRSVFIHQLGVEYVGLGGLFSSLLSFLNLAELGVGSAVLYFLYQPVADNDVDTVRKLLGLIKNIYWKIGLFISGAGLALTPFLRLLVSGEVPGDINIYAIYLLNLLQTSLSYWLFAGKSVILDVYQRDDVSSRICLATSTLRYALQFILLFLLPNYYIYLSIVILTQALERILIAAAVDRRYPEFRKTLPAPQEMTHKVLHKSSGLLFHKIGGVIVNSADALVITGFLGLSILGKYQNYLQIMTAVSGMIGLINSSWYAGIGNTIAREGIDTAYRSFIHYTFLEFCISTFCCCCFLNLYQPFIALWLGPDLLLDDGLIVCICLYFCSLRFMTPGNMFENIGGIWVQDRYRPLLEGLLNLGLNLILVQCLGMYGILLSTILSMVCLSMPWLYHTVVGKLFQKNSVSYLKKLLQYAVSAAACCAASSLACRIIPPGFPPLAALFAKAAISTAVPTALLWGLYRRDESWKWMLRHILSTLRLQRT